jgi:hypothetical protein
MFTRRAIYLSLAAAVIAAMPAIAAPARKPTPRVVTILYSQPCSVSPAPTGGNGTFSNCPADQAFAVLKKEKYASIEVTDSSGHPAAVNFAIDSSGVSSELPTLICASASRLPVSGGVTYAVHPTFNVGDTGCPTPPTSGTIKITLTAK